MKFQNLKLFQKHFSSLSAATMPKTFFVAIADDYERGKALNLILSHLQTPDSLPTHFTGSQLELRDLFDALQSFPLLGGEPITIVDEVDKMGKSHQQALTEFLKIGDRGYLILGAKGKAPLLSAVSEESGLALDLMDEKPWDKEKRLAEQLIERAKSAGKTLSPDIPDFLFERVEKDPALLESEIDKLICFTGERRTITKDDVIALTPSNRAVTIWQTAEDVVWEGGEFPPVDSSVFHGLIPALRNQLHIGLTLASLIESKCPSSSWNSFLPKLWPKLLEKRSSQAARFGSTYFRKGQEKLLEIELLSRNNSTQYGALLDLFRANLRLNVR